MGLYAVNSVGNDLGEGHVDVGEDEGLDRGPEHLEVGKHSKPFGSRK